MLLCSQEKIYFNSLSFQIYTIPTAFWGGRDEEGSNETPTQQLPKGYKAIGKRKGRGSWRGLGGEVERIPLSFCCY